MDPNTALANLRDAMRRLAVHDDGDVEDAVEAFAALDDWLSRGGFPPDDWR